MTPFFLDGFDDEGGRLRLTSVEIEIDADLHAHVHVLNPSDAAAMTSLSGRFGSNLSIQGLSGPILAGSEFFIEAFDIAAGEAEAFPISTRVAGVVRFDHPGVLDLINSPDLRADIGPTGLIGLSERLESDTTLSLDGAVAVRFEFVTIPAPGSIFLMLAAGGFAPLRRRSVSGSRAGAPVDMTDLNAIMPRPGWGVQIGPGPGSRLADHRLV